MNGEEIFHIELDQGIQWQGSKGFSYSLSRADSALVIRATYVKRFKGTKAS